MANTAIENFMTEQPHTIGVDQSLKRAQEFMRQHGVRHLPVQRSGKLVGIISQRDIDFALRVDKASEQDLKVEDAFSSDVFSVERTVPVDQVCEVMAKEKLGCALVTQGDKIIGIFTTVDACRAVTTVVRAGKSG